MATLMNKPKADLTPEELEEREKHEFQGSDRILFIWWSVFFFLKIIKNFQILMLHFSIGKTRLDLCPFWRSLCATTRKFWSTAATTENSWLESRPLTATATWSLKMSKRCGSNDQKASRVSFCVGYISIKFWIRQTAACQSWSLHLQDVPPWRFGHHCPQKSAWGRQVKVCLELSILSRTLWKSLDRFWKPIQWATILSFCVTICQH